jgi:hypothetical protein
MMHVQIVGKVIGKLQSNETPYDPNFYVHTVLIMSLFFQFQFQLSTLLTSITVLCTIGQVSKGFVKTCTCFIAVRLYF